MVNLNKTFPLDGFEAWADIAQQHEAEVAKFVRSKTNKPKKRSRDSLDPSSAKVISRLHEVSDNLRLPLFISFL